MSPLPEPPSADVLQILSEMRADDRRAHPLYPEFERRARKWMTHSFPGAKLFENRVQSLAVLITGIFDDATLRSPMPQAGVTEWRPITKDDSETLGWLFTPAKNLSTHPFKERWQGDDIRVSMPRNWTWATMIIPLSVPAPPHASEAQDGSKE